jgi:hypothetical protein
VNYASALPIRPCACTPSPGDLPVALLTATVEDTATRPPLLAVTVDYEAQTWRADALASHLLDWVLDYALRPQERRAFTSGRALEQIRRAVKTTFGDNNDSWVPGEILLHAICRQFFGSDTVISKVWFKTAVNDTYKGFDAVHCVHLGNELQLWLGEAKFYQDLKAAIRSALNDLRQHLELGYLRSEFMLIADKIEDEHPHAADLRMLMHPNTPIDTAFDRIVAPVFVAYDSPVTCAHTVASTSYKQALEAEVRSAWLQFANKLDPNLPVSVRLFLLPMASKTTFVDAINRELTKWR